jgi:hypothetical protein
MPSVTLEEVRIVFAHDPSHAAALAAWERERAEWLLAARRRDALADRIGRDHPDLPPLGAPPERPTGRALSPMVRVRARLADGRQPEAEVPLPATRAQVVAALRAALVDLTDAPVAEGEVIAV